jgi:hypothetical protein
MLIHDFAKAMVAKDYVGVSKCFAEQSRCFDYCPAYAGLDNFYVFGRPAIEMFYHNKFVLGGLSAMDPVIQDERNVNLYISYGGTIVHAAVTILNYDPQNGLIQELVIRPA